MKVDVKRVEPSSDGPQPAAQSPGGLWPGVLPPPSPPRAIAAFVVAVISDALSFGVEFIPPLQIAVDLITAVILWGLLGWRWPILPALIIEAVPVVALFPTWTMVAGAYVVYSTRRA